MLSDLRGLIEERLAKVVVVGLGYVGLPVACLFAKAGFHVTGIRRDPDKVALINRGVLPFDGEEPGLRELLAEVVATKNLQATTDFSPCPDAQIVILAVETPVDSMTKTPNYASLRAALVSVADNLRPDTLVVIESTISPGTMKHLVEPLLEERSGLRSGKDFWLTNCPERVMPGKLLHNLQHCSRVIGTMSEDAGPAAITLYRQIVRADLDVTDCLTAEIVKTTENAYRDVQIAFANEVALLCESVGADVWQVRELVNKSPGRQMHLPGGGVGGHCIPKDPWLLIAGAGESFVPRLIPAARSINDQMPAHVADLVAKTLAKASLNLAGARIAVLGYAYLENSDDTRNSPSEVLITLLRSQGAEVVVQDPYVQKYAVLLEHVVRGCDCLVFMVAHADYRTLNLTALTELMRTPTVVDARRIFDPAILRVKTFDYICLGAETEG